MLQRKQTIWLLLASVLAFLSLQFPVYTGNLELNGIKVFISNTLRVNIKHGLLLLILTAVLGTLSGVTIFLYKSRKKQLLICLGLTILSFVNLFFYYLQTKTFIDGTYAISALLVLAIPLLTLMAARDIYKDEQLVKSLDRIR